MALILCGSELTTSTASPFVTPRIPTAPVPLPEVCVLNPVASASATLHYARLAALPSVVETVLFASLRRTEKQAF